MSLDDFNKRLDQTGGTWVKVNEPGDEIRGDLVALEYRPMRDYATGQTKVSKAGRQREELVVTFRVDDDQRNGEDDDGTRKVSLNESGQYALMDAIKRSGKPAEAGGRIGLRCTGRKDQMSQADYEAGYKPPVLTRAASDLV